MELSVVTDHDLTSNFDFFAHIIDSLKNFWLALNSVMTLAFLHEFYLNTCKLITRKSIVRSFLGKSAFFSVILLVFVLLERVPMFLLDRKIEKMTGYLISMVSPTVVVFTACLTGASVYFGVYILLSLTRCQRVNEDNHQSAQKYITLYRLVVVAMIFSALKLLVLLIRISFHAVLFTNFQSCMEMTKMGPELEACLSSVNHQFSLATHIIRDTLVGLVELITSNGIMILKHQRNVDQ